MKVAYGVVLDKLGHARSPGEAWAAPAGQVKRVQRSPLRVDRNHDHEWIGEVIDLQMRGGNLVAVAEVSDEVEAVARVRVGDTTIAVPHDLFWSAEHTTGDSIELLALSLTTAPRHVAARPVTLLPGSAHMAAFTTHDHVERQLLNRASEAHLRRRGGEIVIDGHDHTPNAWSPHLEVASSRRPVETRSARVADVSATNRTVEIVAAPYDSEAAVVIDGKRVMESFSNTAWLDVDRQPNRSRIRVWRDHRPELACGRVTSLDPTDPRGLIAEFKLSNTTLGDETLELAQDDVLDASVGFKVLDQRWEGRSRRRVTKAWLHHLGLTSDPAYDGTHVVGVRGAELLA
jgi:HK97 family phage prohead protease